MHLRDSGIDDLGLDECKMMVKYLVICRLKRNIPILLETYHTIRKQPESLALPLQENERVQIPFGRCWEAHQLRCWRPRGAIALCKRCSHAVMESSSELCFGEGYMYVCLWMDLNGAKLFKLAWCQMFEFQLWEFVNFGYRHHQVGFNEFGLKGFGVEAPCHERTEHGNLETRKPDPTNQTFCVLFLRVKIKTGSKSLQKWSKEMKVAHALCLYNNDTAILIVTYSNYSIRATFAAAFYSFHSFVPLEAKQEDGERPTRPRPTFKNQPDEH